MEPTSPLCRAGFVVAALLLTCLGSCAAPNGGDDQRTVTVYSGRNEKLIGPLLERFEEASGIDVQVRYGETAELTATLMEEGVNTPADVFISQDAAALESLGLAGNLRPLPEQLLQRLPSSARSPRGDWVGLSGRARVVVYNTERMRPEDLPRSLDALLANELKGSFGIAPTNASFQAHMAAYMVERGESALRELLAALVRHRPRIYPKNSPIVAAVIAGEIDWGLVNHYYLERALQETPNAPAKNFVMPDGRASRFLDMAGAARLSELPAGRELVDYLLSDTAQRYFTDETFEFALAGADPASAPNASLEQPFDYAAVSAALKTTQRLIQDSGLTRF